MEHVQRTAQFRPSSVQIPLRNHVTGLRCGEAFNLTGMELSFTRPMYSAFNSCEYFSNNVISSVSFGLKKIPCLSVLRYNKYSSSHSFIRTFMFSQIYELGR